MPIPAHTRNFDVNKWRFELIFGYEQNYILFAIQKARSRCDNSQKKNDQIHIVKFAHPELNVTHFSPASTTKMQLSMQFSSKNDPEPETIRDSPGPD
jgi:hypothetical protein